MCTTRLWNHQNDKKFGPVVVKLQALYTERIYMGLRTRALYLSRPKRLTNLPNISISRRFPSKIFIIMYFLVKTYSFTWLVIRASISFFWEGGVSQNWSLPLTMWCFFFVPIFLFLFLFLFFWVKNFMHGSFCLSNLLDTITLLSHLKKKIPWHVFVIFTCTSFVTFLLFEDVYFFWSNSLPLFVLIGYIK